MDTEYYIFYGIINTSNSIKKPVSSTILDTHTHIHRVIY